MRVEAIRRHGREVAAIGVGTVTVLILGALLMWRAAHEVNEVPLATTPRPVTVVEARALPYRSSRSYVGSVRPWIEANVGPQYLSAYVETVLVRPGDSVVRGQVLATLDCANANASSRAFAMEARAIDARQRALADEATRMSGLLDGGFVAPNEVEQKVAQSDAERAQLAESNAKLMSASLVVRDCVLRAPFDGDVGTRMVDPGVFVHPGTPIVSVVDRATVRVTGDAPEKDFDVIPKGTPVRIRMLATGARISALVSRRAPKANSQTRTVHFEIDVSNPKHLFPADTTAIIDVDVGQPEPASEVPIYAATLHEGKAKLFVVESGVAHLRDLPVLGEVGGGLYLAPKDLPEHAQVIIEGRALVSDGDPVHARVEPPPAESDAGAPARGGGYGRPL